MKTSESCQLHLLDRESLTSVCSLLDPVTVANLSCTCRELRDASFQDCLWERFSRQRWKHQNTDLYAQAEATPSLPESQQGEKQPVDHAVGQQLPEPSVNFRSLYTHNNGWTPLHLHQAYICTVPSGYIEYCVSRVPASNFCDAAGDAFYTLRGSDDSRRPPNLSLNLWSTGDRSQPGRMLQRGRSHDPVGSSCITELTAGTAAVGASSGKIFLHDLRPDSPTRTYPFATWWDGNRYHYTDNDSTSHADQGHILHQCVVCAQVLSQSKLVCQLSNTAWF